MFMWESEYDDDLFPENYIQCTKQLIKKINWLNAIENHHRELKRPLFDSSFFFSRNHCD